MPLDRLLIVLGWGVLVVVMALALGRGDADVLLAGLCLAWLGAVLVFHGRKEA